MVKLVYNDPTGRERFVEMGAQNAVVMIGRNPECGIQTNNASVSRVHAMLTYKDGKLMVQDPPNGRPTNGTKVDGMRLQPGEILELFANSELVCGNFKIKIVDSGTGDGLAQMGNAAPAPVASQYAQQVQQGLQPLDISMSSSMSGPAMRDPRFQQPQPVQAGQYPQPNGYGSQMPPQGYNQMQVNPNVQMPSAYPSAGPGFDQPDPSRGFRQNEDPGASRANFDSAGRGSSYDGARNKQRMMRPGAPGYHPGQVHAMAAVSMPQSGPAGSSIQPVVSPGQPVDGGAVETLRASNAALEEEIKKLKTRLDECDREVSDYKQRCDNHETLTTSLKDMIDKLKEQLDHQKDQNKECKKELSDALEKNNSLEIELATLKESLESKGMASSNAESTISNLKVQLSTKTRQLSEALRDLDLAQYNVREERENAERLEENVTSLNASLEESQRHCRDMKKVVEQHESVFEELRANLEDRNQEIQQLQLALKRQGGGDAAALLSEISQIKESLNKKTVECENLRKEVADLKRNSSQSGSSQDCGLDVEHLRDVAQKISDGVNLWRGDFENLENSISDLQRVFVPYVRLDVSALTGQDKVRVENMLKEYDPRAIFEEIGNSLDQSQSTISELKGQIVELKTSLETDD